MKRRMRLDRQDDAVAYAVALNETTIRYHRGYMGRAAWRAHMRSLWGAVRERRLLARVTALVAPGVADVR